MNGRSNRTDDAVDRIVAKLSAGWSVSAACKAAKIGRRTYYDWREEDAEFAKRCDDAIESGTDALEDSAARQAFQGNASLMALLLKGRRPEKYKDRVAAEHTGANGGPLEIVGIEVAKTKAD